METQHRYNVVGISNLYNYFVAFTLKFNSKSSLTNDYYLKKLFKADFQKEKTKTINTNKRNPMSC